MAHESPAASSGDYFLRVAQQTPTRLWVNNPTEEEARLAQAVGAISCTTNPTYAARMIDVDASAERIVADCVARHPDDAAAADAVQQEFVRRILEVFLPIHERTRGLQGWVSIQGDPLRDEDADHIVDEALRYRRLGPNFIAKIPATRAGLKAIAELLPQGVPVIATEMFSISQAIHVTDVYVRELEKTDVRPAWFPTHITGIFDEYLSQWAEQSEAAVAPEDLDQAGLAVARRQHRLWQERRYPGTLLGGGVRAPHHFTGLVGGDFHITMNWSTIDQLQRDPPPLESRIDTATPADVIERLLAAVPDFRSAWEEDALTVDAFADYGPVQHFRDKFIAGWQRLLDAVRRARAQTVGSGGGTSQERTR